ncbi:hypothetical protein E2P81_ATG07676 [Venturia nashicola]|uniref:Uncharacterized protein n=1 Tax=Venturia nashicola TaxID=86259 RepID=A0A4Z1P5E1_9PEZI|nr:hypothetical protein E6O75_ATG07840 [Venturia nashicola]TLD22483.1 hypothetical protein E2P81_ATG07676 [Venturia nashicola]
MQATWNDVHARRGGFIGYEIQGYNLVLEGCELLMKPVRNDNRVLGFSIWCEEPVKTSSDGKEEMSVAKDGDQEIMFGRGNASQLVKMGVDQAQKAQVSAYTVSFQAAVRVYVD